MSEKTAAQDLDSSTVEWKVDSNRRLFETLVIFEKYAETDDYSVLFYARHEILIGGPRVDVVSEEDLERLEDLGWYPDRYDEFGTENFITGL